LVLLLLRDVVVRILLGLGKLFSKGLVPENSRLAAEEGKLSKKTPRVVRVQADGFVVVRLLPFPDGVLVSSCSGPRISFGEILCLDYVHHVTAKFKTLFPYGGFSLTYAWFTNGSISIWFTWKRIPKTSQALIDLLQ
jgi:hypothetical protein